MTMRVSKDRIDMDDKVLQKPVLKDYGESVVSDNSGTSYTIDLTQGNVFNITLTGNCAFTFSNPPASGTAGSFTLILTQDATGSRTVTWPAAVKWTGNTTPTLYTVAGSVNILTFLTVNAGTRWFGAHAGGKEPHGDYIAVAHDTSPYFTLLDHTTPGSVSLATTYTLAGGGQRTAFSPF